MDLDGRLRQIPSAFLWLDAMLRELMLPIMQQLVPSTPTEIVVPSSEWDNTWKPPPAGGIPSDDEKPLTKRIRQSITLLRYQCLDQPGRQFAVKIAAIHVSSPINGYTVCAVKVIMRTRSEAQRPMQDFQSRQIAFLGYDLQAIWSPQTVAAQTHGIEWGLIQTL
ncbi:uncharacterized protein PG986_004187 [Apiospora aurea]|uniref:Uncharacterized protein n=1 Tax=Apiospora aurea TaxID=335848 RepID=A0ABR1QM44_9PEZI